MINGIHAPFSKGRLFMWFATRARIPGNSHLKNKLACQDFAERYVGDDFLLCVVADGASIAPFGEIGASIACESIKHFFECTKMNEVYRLFGSYQLANEIKKCFDFFLNQKRTQIPYNTSKNDFSSTLAFVVVYNDQNFFISGSIGDCCVNAFSGQKWETINRLKNFGNTTRTFFITDNDADMQFKINVGKLSDVHGFILTTDGCANGGLVFHNSIDSEIAYHIFNGIKKQLHTEMWLETYILQTFRKTTNDDLSIIVLYDDIICDSSSKRDNDRMKKKQKAEIKKRKKSEKTEQKSQKKDRYKNRRHFYIYLIVIILAIVFTIALTVNFCFLFHHISGRLLI